MSTMIFFFKQKTAYEMRISDWSSDVCSSDLAMRRGTFGVPFDKMRVPVREVVVAVRDHIGILTRPDADRNQRADKGERSTRSERHLHARSEERRVGKESVSTFRSRWAPYH